MYLYAKVLISILLTLERSQIFSSIGIASIVVERNQEEDKYQKDKKIIFIKSHEMIF